MKSNDGLACLGAVILAPLVLIFSAVFSGIIGAQLWAWFVVTTFNAPQLSLPAAIGLAMVGQYFTGVSGLRKTDRKQSSSDAIYDFVVAIVATLITLAMGWVVFQFMPK